ncbi:MAG: glycine cleavage system protein H [Myxococcota bacterium]
MTRTSPWSRYLAHGLIFVGLLALIIVTLPMVATLAFVFRMLLLAAFAVVVVAFAASPRLRRYIVREADATISYAGLTLPYEELVHPAHAWTRPVEGSEMVVGVDDLAQRALGPVDDVSLPAIGTRVRQGEVLWLMRHGGRRLEVKAPVDGVVARVNGLLLAQPTLINEAPYGAGWAVAVTPTNLRENRKLLRRGARARAWFRGEVDRLKLTLAPQLIPSPVMQDGGALVADLHRQMDDATWERIRLSFF